MPDTRLAAAVLAETIAVLPPEGEFDGFEPTQTQQQAAALLADFAVDRAVLAGPLAFIHEVGLFKDTRMHLFGK